MRYTYHAKRANRVLPYSVDDHHTGDSIAAFSTMEDAELFAKLKNEKHDDKTKQRSGV